MQEKTLNSDGMPDSDINSLEVEEPGHDPNLSAHDDLFKDVAKLSEQELEEGDGVTEENQSPRPVE